MGYYYEVNALKWSLFELQEFLINFNKLEMIICKFLLSTLNEYKTERIWQE